MKDEEVDEAEEDLIASEDCCVLSEKRKGMLERWLEGERGKIEKGRRRVFIG